MTSHARDYDFSDASGGEEGSSEAKAAGPAEGGDVQAQVRGEEELHAVLAALLAERDTETTAKVRINTVASGGVVWGCESDICRGRRVGSHFVRFSIRASAEALTMHPPSGLHSLLLFHITTVRQMRCMPHPLLQGLGTLKEHLAGYPGGVLLWALKQGPEDLLSALIDVRANPNLRDAGAPA